MRESGYYWVRVSEQANMEISLYIKTLRQWVMNGVSGFINDDHWFEIGQRIPDNETLKKLNAKSISPS